MKEKELNNDKQLIIIGAGTPFIMEELRDVQEKGDKAVIVCDRHVDGWTPEKIEELHFSLNAKGLMTGEDPMDGIDDEIYKKNKLTWQEREGIIQVFGRKHFMNMRGIQAPTVRDSPKVGRNEPCPCGSGKKYKKCCGK